MKNKRFLILTMLMLLSAVSCQSATERNKSAHTSEKVQVVNKNPVPTPEDEKAFRKVLLQLKSLLKSKNLDASAALLHFPFFTGRDSGNDGKGPATDPVNSSEFTRYQKDIFNKDVIRLLPAYTEEQLSEIDSKTDDPYYRSLAKLADRGSKLYEVYFQYPEKGTNAESFFGFVFGRINGKYRAIGMYTKWPIK